ncbi:MAG: hypothetical protein V4692_08000, partial [Bdellovibrionota bacterium]
MKFVSIFKMISMAALVMSSTPVNAADLKNLSLSATDQSAAEFLKGDAIRFRQGAEFVKVAFVFEKDEAVAKVTVESCELRFNDGVEFFFSPGFRSSYAEAGKKSLSVQVPGKNEKVRTIALVFGNNADLCISSIKVWDAKGKEINLSLGENTASEISVSENPTDVLKHFVDREYTNGDKGELWRYRFRSDGTFFIRGYADDMSGAREFSAHGTYKISERSKKNAKLELEGFRYGTPQPWDGVVCSKDCGLSASA